MRRIYTALVLWDLGALLVASAIGLAAALGWPVGRSHVLVGLFAAIFACLVHSLLIIHFIGSMKWIQQTGPTAGLADTRMLRRAWVKDPAFPAVVFAALAAVAAAVSGGGWAGGAVPAGVHVALAIANFPLTVWALLLARKALAANEARVAHVRRLAEERQRAGLVREEPRERLASESERAGGLVFLFLAANVWVLYGYLRFVLRRPGEPILPYLVACVLLAGAGWLLLRRRGRGRPPTAPVDPPGEEGSAPDSIRPPR